VGRDRTVPCERCGTSWEAPARFCGRCGDALAARGSAPPERAAAGDRRWLVVTGGLVGVVALLAGASVALGDLSLPRGDADPAVSLPEAGELGESPGLDPAEREAALAPFDPDRTVCAPAGCEVWRRPLDVRWGRVGPPQWVVGSPVVIEDGHLVGLELETGEVRWQLPIADELRSRPGSPVDLSWGGVLLAGDDEHVVLATGEGVQLVSQTGDVIWARSLPADGAHLTWAHVTGTSVVLGYEEPPDIADLEEAEPVHPLVTVTVLDAADGQLRWSQPGFGNLLPVPTLADEQDLVLVEADGALAALELATGEQRYELPGGPDVWPTHAGGVLGMSRSDELPTGTSKLFDASDGTVRLDLPAAIHSLLEVDGRVIALLGRTAGSGGDASAEAFAVDPDGSIAWRLAVEHASDDVCCPSILELDGRRVRISGGPGTSAVVADVTDGSLRGDDPLHDGSAAPGGQQWQIGRRLLMEMDREPGDQGYVLRDSAGRTVGVRGEGWFLSPSSDPEIVLIASSRELVAVRLR
jgi:outer membrane protein assembly factor BamB